MLIYQYIYVTSSRNLDKNSFMSNLVSFSRNFIIDVYKKISNKQKRQKIRSNEERMNSARAAEISIKDGKPRLCRRATYQTERVSEHPSLGLARIKRPLYFGLQGCNLQQAREHLFVLEEEMERWLREEWRGFGGVGIACLANVAVIESQ